MTQSRPTILSFDSESQNSSQSTYHAGSNVKRRKNKHQRHQNNRHVEYVKHVDENGYSLPLEMKPVIDVIMQYGRKTNALGNLGAAQILSDISIELRKIGLDKTNQAVKELVENAERTAENIRLQFENAYDEREKQ